MTRYLTDEHVATAVADGLRDRGVDVVRVQEVGLMNTPDPDILEWAAADDRVFVTFDRRTVTGYANDRVRAGLPMPGVVVLHRSWTIGQLIDELYTAGVCAMPDDFRDQVRFVPL